MSTSGRRAIRFCVIILVFLVLACASYQGVATALERRRFPYPGSLIGIGDRQLHLYCIGEGTPTVVLEAPAAGISAAWAWVQPPVGEVARVCSYDRSGLGWSQAGTSTYTPAAVPEQLHMLLSSAGEQAPIVLVGQGLGAAFARLYASRHASNTAALVLIDPPTPATAPSERSVRIAAASPWLARIGLLRAMHDLSGNESRLPEPSAGALAAFSKRPDHLTRAARELSQWDATIALADAAELPVDLPVTTVATASLDPTAALLDQHAAALATRSILDAVAAVRDGRRRQ
jgi:pimeloyl-ACP methyl ester carboxylesterase